MDALPVLTCGDLPPGLWYVAGGVDAATAIGPGLDEAAAADLVVYDRDPLADLSELDNPAHVVLNDQLVR